MSDPFAPPEDDTPTVGQHLSAYGLWTTAPKLLISATFGPIPAVMAGASLVMALQDPAGLLGVLLLAPPSLVAVAALAAGLPVLGRGPLKAALVPVTREVAFWKVASASLLLLYVGLAATGVAWSMGLLRD